MAIGENKLNRVSSSHSGFSFLKLTRAFYGEISQRCLKWILGNRARPWQGTHSTGYMAEVWLGDEWLLNFLLFLIMKTCFIFGHTGPPLLRMSFLVAGNRGCSLAVVFSLHAAVACAVSAGSWGSGFSGCSWTLEHSLSSCPTACGIFPGQGQSRVLFIGRRILMHCNTEVCF